MKYIFWIILISSLIMMVYGPDPVYPGILALGVIMNTLVIGLNGWKMPVRGKKDDGVRHTPMTKETRLKFLGDIIPVGFGIASIGDFMIIAGLMGIWANRGYTPSVEAVALTGFALWVTGWGRGFRIFEKWPKEERRDVRKNFPIILILLALGNLIHFKGCSTPELQASSKGIRDTISEVARGTKKTQKVQEIQKYHDLGKIAEPDHEFLTKLTQDVMRQEKLREKEIKQKETKKNRDDARAIIMTVERGESLTVEEREAMMSRKDERQGPFCRVTCTGCHGGKWDVETAPELCRAGWIPQDSLEIPAWHSLTDKYEEYSTKPGPARVGFQSYKLYWSDDRSEAKEIHPSSDR